MYANDMQVNSFNVTEDDITFVDTVVISASFLLQDSSDEETVTETRRGYSGKRYCRVYDNIEGSRCLLYGLNQIVPNPYVHEF
jgi:hypothetical protein